MRVPCIEYEMCILMKLHPIIITAIIVLVSSEVIAARVIESWSVGSGVGMRYHNSESSFQLSPGPSFFLIASPSPSWETEAKFRFGSLFGYDFTGSLSGRHLFSTENIWRPAIGVQFSCSGGFIPFHRSGPEYIIPSLPEWGLAVDIVPLRLTPGLISISFLECTVGTDLRYPCRVLLLDVTLMRFIIQLSGGKRSSQ